MKPGTNTRPLIRTARAVALAALVGGALASAGCATVGEKDSCISRRPDLAGTAAFYELIDLVNLEAWGTPDFTPEEFAEFKPPFLWRKNQPRGGGGAGPDLGEFLKSPGCTQDGTFTYLTVFDREFLNVVKLKSLNGKVDDDGLIRETVLEKYHRLVYVAGRTVSLLESPDGNIYILVSRDIDRTADTFPVPEGWKLMTRMLEEDLVVELFGDVSVLRTKNEDSYQGPIPAGTVF